MVAGATQRQLRLAAWNAAASPAIPASKQEQEEARKQELHADARSRFEALDMDGVGTLDAPKARQLAANLGLVMTVEEQALEATAGRPALLIYQSPACFTEMIVIGSDGLGRPRVIRAVLQVVRREPREE